MDYLDSNGTQINPVLWAIRQLHAANVTVLRIFGAGVEPNFTMITTPGTAGADGKTWPNGVLPAEGWSPAQIQIERLDSCWVITTECSVVQFKQISNAKHVQNLPKAFGPVRRMCITAVSRLMRSSCCEALWTAGVYNWDAVTGLDKIVGWCRAHGIKVIISFLDNWSMADSKSSVCTHHGRPLLCQPFHPPCQPRDTDQRWL